MKTERKHSQHHKTNVDTNKYKGNKENHDLKEDYITISQEPGMEKRVEIKKINYS